MGKIQYVQSKPIIYLTIVIITETLCLDNCLNVKKLCFYSVKCYTYWCKKDFSTLRRTP